MCLLRRRLRRCLLTLALGHPRGNTAWCSYALPSPLNTLISRCISSLVSRPWGRIFVLDRPVLLRVVDRHLVSVRSNRHATSSSHTRDGTRLCMTACARLVDLSSEISRKGELHRLPWRYNGTARRRTNRLVSRALRFNDKWARSRWSRMRCPFCTKASRDRGWALYHRCRWRNWRSGADSSRGIGRCCVADHVFWDSRSWCLCHRSLWHDSAGCALGCLGRPSRLSLSCRPFWWRDRSRSRRRRRG
jgi:hypothetical protein